MYMECDNTDPLESDSDSNYDLPPFVNFRKVLKMTTKLLVLHIGPRFIY